MQYLERFYRNRQNKGVTVIDIALAASTLGEVARKVFTAEVIVETDEEEMYVKDSYEKVARDFGIMLGAFSHVDKESPICIRVKYEKDRNKAIVDVSYAGIFEIKEYELLRDIDRAVVKDYDYDLFVELLIEEMNKYLMDTYESGKEDNE